MPEPQVESWLRQHAGVDAPGEVLRSRSGAVLLIAGDQVVKLHRAGTDGTDLAARLRLACATPELLHPLSATPEAGPDGRWASRWPRVTPLVPDPPTAPWREAAGLLAALHSHPVEAGTPPDGAIHRLRRSIDRLAEVQRGRIVARDVRAAADVVRAAAPTTVPFEPSGPSGPSGRSVTLVHGDWHLGQLGRVGDAGAADAADGGWRLLDVDDLGRGDPAWDLGRPAGFWAAGLLPDRDWYAFLGAYRAAGGPAVPAAGDPWPALEPVARACLVQAAAVGVTRAIKAAERLDELDDALVATCARMLPHPSP